jgi:hypothetical protein
MAVIIAVGVNSDGRREVLGMDIGPSEAETFWTAFLRKLARRGLRGVKLVIPMPHEGIKAAVSKVLNATWQRCRVHFMRNVLAHAGKSGRRVVSAFIATTFAQDDAEAARAQWRRVADQLRPKLPKLAAFMDEAEADVLAYMSFPAAHRAKLHSTNPIERVNGEVKRRTDVVGIFPNEDAIIRLVGAILLEQNDEWAVQRARYMTLETITHLSDDPAVSLPAIATTGPTRAVGRGDTPSATPPQGTRSRGPLASAYSVCYPAPAGRMLDGAFRTRSDLLSDFTDARLLSPVEDPDAQCGSGYRACLAERQPFLVRRSGPPSA